MDSSTNNDASNVDTNERVGRNSLYTLEFEDFVDLQTRLVLLPNQDDDCIGAKIHSYIPKQSELDQEVPSDDKFADLLLVGIDGHPQTDNDWTKEDFTSILSVIRNTSKPILLHFIHPPPQAQSDQPCKSENSNCSTSYYDDSDSEDISEISMSSSEDVNLADEIKNKLSKWGTNFADAAERYANHAVQASKELAKENTNGMHERRIANLTQNHDHENDVSGKMNPPCALFLQTSNGKCVPLKKNYSNSRHHVRLNVKEDGIPMRNFFSKKPTVTNTSVLVIRKSADISCPRIGFTYQWYRSHTMEQSLSNNDSITSLEQWIKMDYETSAIYQPTTTDVGYRVKCIVSIKENDEATTEVVCELPSVIQCDKTLFDVAYKSFSPDNDGSLLCSFDNMHGRDELQSLEKIHINLYTKRCSEKAKQSGFRMVINTKDSSRLGIEGNAISAVLARAYGSAAKSFFLAFEDPLQEGTQIGLKLDAPSRIARESFLIALGIARFDGDLKDLNTFTKLFPERPPLESEYPAPNYQSSKENAATKEEVISVMETPEKATNTSQKSTLTPFNTKMMALESELEHDLGILRDKLECKNKVVFDLREELKILKNEKVCFSEQISDLKGLLHLSEEKTKSLSELLEAEKNAKESYRTKLIDRSKELEVSRIEFEKALRSLENEKTVLTAAVEARERKLDNLKELKDTVKSLTQKLQEKEEECNKMMDLYETNNHLKDRLNESSTLHNELEDKLKEMDHARQTALSELQKEREISTQTKVELDKLKTLLHTVKGERNNFKQKADSLAKEMSRLRKSDLEARNYERMQHDYKKLQDEVLSLRSERRAIKDELEATQIAHAAYKEAQKQAGEDTNLIGSLSKCAELERVISDLTEYLHAKEMQLETVQSANRKLSEEILMIQKNSYDGV